MHNNMPNMCLQRMEKRNRLSESEDKLTSISRPKKSKEDLKRYEFMIKILPQYMKLVRVKEFVLEPKVSHQHRMFFQIPPTYVLLNSQSKYRHSSISAVSISGIFDLTWSMILPHFSPL